MNKHEKYKDSGIEWIGEIPEHWEVKRLKWIISESLKYGANESAVLDDKELPRYIRITDFGEDGKLKEETFKSLPFDVASEYLLENGDILFARSGATVGKTFQFKNYQGQACFAGYLIKAKPNKNIINSDFLYFFTKSDGYESWCNYIFNKATIQNIGADKYSLLEVPVPSIKEQTTIAIYLDRKTTEINRIIANKQKLIALYEEEKQAVINQAVTKGLDSSVKLKDSGVEWLGEIPEHWEVKKLNYSFGQIGSGTTPTSGKTEYYENGEFNWLQTGDLNDSEIVETSKKITQNALDEISTLRFYPVDSIVIAMYGATIGKTGILKIESTTNQACCVLSKPKKMFPKFVFYWFSSVKKHIISLSYGGGQPNINQEQIRSLKIQQPTIVEQQTIVAHIEKECVRLDTIIEKFNKQIELLQEYRTTLISEVVTGKVKVTE